MNGGKAGRARAEKVGSRKNGFRFSSENRMRRRSSKKRVHVVCVTFRMRRREGGWERDYTDLLAGKVQ